MPCYIMHKQVEVGKQHFSGRKKDKQKLQAEKRMESSSCCRRKEGETEDEISGHPFTDKTHG